MSERRPDLYVVVGWWHLQYEVWGPYTHDEAVMVAVTVDDDIPMARRSVVALSRPATVGRLGRSTTSEA